MKHCSRCRYLKPFEEFKKNLYSSSGISPECKSCDRVRRKGEAIEPFIGPQINTGPVKVEGHVKKPFTKVSNADYILQSKFKIPIGGYDKMLEAQEGKCQICRRDANTFGKRLHVDHDRKCCAGARSCGKCVRKLLCANCNSVLGRVDDNIEVLAAMVAYLNDHNSVTL